MRSPCCVGSAWGVLMIGFVLGVGRSCMYVAFDGGFAGWFVIVACGVKLSGWSVAVEIERCTVSGLSRYSGFVVVVKHWL